MIELLTNILQYLEKTVAEVPDKVAFVTDQESLSFRGLYHTARLMGAEWIRRGYEREPVAVLMDKQPTEIAAFLSVVYAGCYYAAMDAAMPKARMGQILSSLMPRLLICDRKNAAKARELSDGGYFAGQVICFEDLLDRLSPDPSEDDRLLNRVRDRQIDTDPIYIVFTSGSTGVPKGVAACHRSVIDYTEHLCEAIGFNRDTVFANQTPLYFDAPLKEIMPTLKFGATTHLLPRKLFMFPALLCRYLNDHRINTVCWVVSALTMISSLGMLEKDPPRYLTTVCFGSEVFPRPQYDLWRKVLPDARFFNLYGPTEATGMSCYWEARDLLPDEPIPIGRPFRNTDVILLTDDQRRAGEGEEGEICLRGTCVTLGYYNNPTVTASAFVQNPLNPFYPERIYRTGDIGRYNDRGELVFVSRRDAQIKLMGHRIELGEIETAASQVAGVGLVACVFDAEARRICLYYTEKGGVELKPSALTAALRKALPAYMIPASCEKLAGMPLTPNGKIDRRGLRERAEQGIN